MADASSTPLRIAVRDLDPILRDARLVLVAFEGENCAPCETLAPRLDDVAREFGARLLVVRVPGADEPSLAARHHLVWVPTLVFWHAGRERMRLAGAVSADTLRSHIQFLLGDGPLPEPALGPRRVVHGAFRPTTSH